MGTVDLDKLEQEIIAFGSVMTSGVDGDWLEVELEVTKFRVHRDGFVCENDGTEMTDIVLTLARHVAPVAPDPGLREEIDWRDVIARVVEPMLNEPNQAARHMDSYTVADAVLSVLAERGVR